MIVRVWATFAFAAALSWAAWRADAIVPNAKDGRAPNVPRAWGKLREEAPDLAEEIAIPAALGCAPKGGEAPKRQLRLVLAGLMGSGKSTLCRMLRHLLGGVWVNQDEFSHLKKRAKLAFLAEIEKVAKDGGVPVLMVDKINTMKQHRREIMERIHAGVAGDTVLIQFKHPRDMPFRWTHAVDLCEARIHARGEGHRTLMGDEPKLRGILQMTAKGAEALGQEERVGFRACLVVDMTQDPVSIAAQVLGDLHSNGLLPGYDLEELQSERALAEALGAATDMELRLKQH